MSDTSRFFKVIVKKSEKTGGDLDAWMKTNVSDVLKNEDFAEKLYYLYDSGSPPPGAPVAGTSGTSSPPEASFVYLDVGAWIGSADGTWGKNPGPGRKRDFGIVCGPIVMLCTFSFASSLSNAPEWDAIKGASQKHAKSLAKVVEVLSGTGELGSVIVRRVLIGEPANPRWPSSADDWVIHVIMGDMHIPVLDELSQTYGGSDMVVVNASNNPRVQRHGRVDVGSLEALVTQLVGPNDTDGLRKVVKAINWFADLSKKKKAALEAGAGVGAAAAGLAGLVGLAADAVIVGGVAVGALKLAGDAYGIEHNTMSKAQAEKWYQYYRKGVDGGFPADIFESAGTHLLDFMTALVKYKKESSDLLPVKFHQLGDMLDFWVGFTCHFQASAANTMPVNAHGAKDDAKGSDYGADEVNYWAANLFNNTKQGKIVAGVLDQAEAFAPVYLWGNHDNYLGDGLTPTYWSGTSKTLAARKPSYDERGVFMEHGHQWESSNADNAGPIWGTSLVNGTDCPTGLFVTQAAFIRPKPVRGFEGTAAGLVAKFSTPAGIGQRLTQVEAAARKYVQSQGRFYVYVMGHTHEGCLSRVAIHTNAPLALLDQFRKDEGTKDSAVWIEDSTSHSALTTDMWGGNFFAESTLRLGWKTMPGFEGHDWISLEDPEAPDNTFAKDMWRYVREGVSSTSGQQFPCTKDGSGLTGAPPGRYEARAYIDSSDTKAFRRSRFKFAVYGFSLEGNRDHRVGTEYTFDANGVFDRHIMLRWAWGDEKHDARPDMWFALFKKGEGKWKSLSADVRQGRPWKYFRDIASNHPGYGRWGIDGDSWFHDALTRSPGIWQLRAFYDNDGDTEAQGRIEFVIKKAGK